MQLSARNQIIGRIRDVNLGGVMAKVTVDIEGGHTLISTITRDAATELGLTPGDEVTVIIKSTEVMIGKE
jgi:molybdate transport system regulatory protein